MFSKNQDRPWSRGGGIAGALFASFCITLLSLCLIGANKAKAGDYTKQNARVVRVQADPSYNGGAATPASVPITFFLASRIVNDNDANDVKGANEWLSVTVDLLDPARADDSITAASKTVSPPQLAALIRQYALDRANAAGIQ
jgi:hypothetical protein